MLAIIPSLFATRASKRGPAAAKRPKRATVNGPTDQSTPLPPRTSGPRNASIDTLRGLAIALMIVDHVALYLLEIRIEPGTIRFATRLALPLFAILFGYYLAHNQNRRDAPLPHAGRKRRVFQIIAAAISVNVVFFPIHEKFDILASLAACYLLFLLIGHRFLFLAASIVLYRYDASRILFDYSFTVVFTLVALGVLLHHQSFQRSLAAAALVALASLLIVDPPSLFVMLFALPAIVLVRLALMSDLPAIGWLAWVGRNPLSVYVAQYYLIVATRYAVLYLQA